MKSKHTAWTILLAAVTLLTTAGCPEADNNGNSDNDVTTTIETAVTPTANPPAGEYTAAQTVTLTTATTGAAIYYTTNGDIPTASGNQYVSAISVAETTTIKAIAVKSGMNNSAVLTAVYTIGDDPSIDSVENDISKLTGGLWIYDYWSKDHNFYSVFQFNSDFTVYEGKVLGGLMKNYFQLHNVQLSIYLNSLDSGMPFNSYDLGSLHEQFIEDSKLKYFTKSVIQTFEWGEVSYIVKDDVITLSNGVELHRLVYSEPPILDIVSLYGDNPSAAPHAHGSFIVCSWEDNEFVFTGIEAVEPNAEIEVGIPDYTNGHRIIAKSVADANGDFRVTMPPMPAGFLIETYTVVLFAKTPGKDRSTPILFSALFLFHMTHAGD